MGSLFGPKKYSNSADDSPEPAKNYAANPTGELFGDKLYIGIDETTAVVGDTYSLVEQDNTIYLRRGSDGTLVTPGVPAGGGGNQIGFLPPGHVDHSGGSNDGEIILGDVNGEILSALPVDVRANGTIINNDNGLIGIDNGRIVFNVSTVVQAGDERPVNSAGVKTYVDTAIDNLPPGHDDISGILSISSTPDKVAEIGIYDTDSTRIGQQFVISTVDTVQDIQDININSEPASGTSTTQLAQRLEITLNKATAVANGELRVPTAQAVVDYVTSITTNPVTAAHVRALLQDDSGIGGISWSIDSNTGDIIGVANIPNYTPDDWNAKALIGTDIVGDSSLAVTAYGNGTIVNQWQWSNGTPTVWQDVIDDNLDLTFHLGGGSPTASFSSTLGTQSNPGQLYIESTDAGVSSWAIFTAYFSFASNNNVVQLVSLVATSGSTPINAGSLKLLAGNLRTSTTTNEFVLGEGIVATPFGDSTVLSIMPVDAGETAQAVQTAITGRLDDGAGTSTDSDNAYTTTEADRLLGLKQDQITGDSTSVTIPNAGAGSTDVTLNTTRIGASGPVSTLFFDDQNTDVRFSFSTNNVEVETQINSGIPNPPGLLYYELIFDDLQSLEEEYPNGTIRVPYDSIANPAGGKFDFDTDDPNVIANPPFPTAAEANDDFATGHVTVNQVTTGIAFTNGDITLTGAVVKDGNTFDFTGAEDTVLYTPQTLTNAQQIQARANIAASRQTELWAPGQDYVVGDNVLVVFSGDIIGFACLQAHTSDNTPGGTGNGQPRINVDNSNWQQIGFQNIIPWVTGFAWNIGDVVLYRDLTPNNLSNSGLYIRRVGGVDTNSSQNPFVNTADWLPLGGSGAGGIEVLSSDPSSPTDGQVWYNSSQEIIKYFDGELTLDIAKFLGYFSTDPTHSSANHSDGDMWYNTTENEFKYFSGSGVVHTIITNLDSITALSDGQAVLDSIATETTNREAADTTLQNNINTEATTRVNADTTLQNNIDAEAVARESGDAAERDFVETTLHVDAADSQSYYQFSGQPAIFSEVPATDYGITIAMPQTIEDTEALVQAENIGETTKVFKLTLRYGDGANDTKQYVVTTGGYNFTISDERTSETFRLPTIEGTYSAASVTINGTSTRRQDCFLAIGGWYGRIAQVDMAHVLNVSNGDILAGRSLEVGQDYSEHTIADNNNTAVVGLVFDNQTTGSHTGINAYALQRRNRIVRYRAATSNGLFSFRNGNSVVDRFHPSTTPNVVEDQDVPESNWLGLKMVTIQNAISDTSANGDGNRLTYAVGDKMLVAFGEAVNSTSAGIPVPGIASTKNPSSFTGGSANLVLLYTGGEDPSEEYSNYSSANEADFNAHIYDMEYSNASGAWTFFFGGETVGETAIATKAAGFHGTSIWNMATISDATRAGAGGIIRSVNLGGNIAGLASDTNFWVTTELGALWVSKTPWLATGYGGNALLQAHVNANDPTSDTKRDFTFRGFQYFDEHGSIGAGDDGHIYRLVINPEVTFTVTFGNVTHTARFRFNDNTTAMHTFFGNPASYSPTLAGTGVSLTTTAPGGEPADQLYLDYSVNGQNTPVVSYQWVGVLSTTDDDFETYSPFRRIDLANTVVDIHYPDGGATYHIALSSNVNDYTVGGEANGAVDQMVAAVNTHTAQGHSAVRVDAGFADTITNTKPVLRLDQTGTHALQNAPTVTIAHPSGQNTGTLAVARFADGGYDTIGRPGGLFDPNDYDTRGEVDAKIAAIASTHGYAENIVANAGSGGTTYSALDRLQIGTEIYNVRAGLQESLTTDQLAVVNADPFTSANYRTSTAQDAIDSGKQDDLTTDQLAVVNADPFTSANYRTSANQDTIDSGKQETIDADNAAAIRTTLNVADGATRTRLGVSEITVTEFLNKSEEASFNWNGDTITIHNPASETPYGMPTGIISYRFTFSGYTGAAAYNGTITVPVSAVSYSVGGFAIIDTTANGVTVDPALPTSGFINNIPGTVVASYVVDSPVYSSGDFEFEGDVTRNGNVFTIGSESTLDAFTTDDLTEGSTNLYYTDGRARAALAISESPSGTLNYKDSGGTARTFVNKDTVTRLGVQAPVTY